MVTLIASLLFASSLAASAYYAFLLLAGLLHRRCPCESGNDKEMRRFLVVIAAHNEENVIADTVTKARAVNYPADRFQIHVVADHCADGTAVRAAQAGAMVHERASGERGSKSAALTWWFSRVRNENFDVILLLDADARIDSGFIAAINRALAAGANVVQGQQIISNPESGWYASLASAMYRIENVVHNRGRTYWGGSARHMGDAIAFLRSIVERHGFGVGLTEDHLLRQKLLLAGIRIAYEPHARAYNEAAQTWEDAKKQRLRWMKGTVGSDRAHRSEFLRQAWRQRDLSLVEAWVESWAPSFSFLVVMAGASFLFSIVPNTSTALVVASGANVAFVIAFPFLGLAIARAPARAYRGLLAGPFFIAWRVVARARLALFSTEVVWHRTPHGPRSS